MLKKEIVTLTLVKNLYNTRVPVIILYTVLAAFTIAFAGAAINVNYRDVSATLLVLLSLLMYASMSSEPETHARH